MASHLLLRAAPSRVDSRGRFGAPFLSKATLRLAHLMMSPSLECIELAT